MVQNPNREEELSFHNAISHRAHHRSWTLYRKEDLKRKNIYHISDYEAAASILIISREKKILKKDPDDY